MLADEVANLPEQKTEVFRGVLEQLRWFAGKQVKSVAVGPRVTGREEEGRSDFL